MISITKIDNRVKYKETIDEFKKILIQFKESRDEPIFSLKTSTDKEGANDTLYTHILLNY